MKYLQRRYLATDNIDNEIQINEYKEQSNITINNSNTKAVST